MSYRLQQLKDSLKSGSVELPTFRKLLKQELHQKMRRHIRNLDLHTLTERIQAHPNQKVEVKFRIKEKIEGADGRQNLASQYVTPRPSHGVA